MATHINRLVTILALTLSQIGGAGVAAYTQTEVTPTGRMPLSLQQQGFLTAHIAQAGDPLENIIAVAAGDHERAAARSAGIMSRRAVTRRPSGGS